jgi:hypothetical protein
MRTTKLILDPIRILDPDSFYQLPRTLKVCLNPFEEVDTVYTGTVGTYFHVWKKVRSFDPYREVYRY